MYSHTYIHTYNMHIKICICIVYIYIHTHIRIDRRETSPLSRFQELLVATEVDIASPAIGPASVMHCCRCFSEGLRFRV